IDREMSRHGLTIERERLAAYVAERPSAAEVRGWLERLQMERVTVIERPLVVESGSGQRFLQHPLLRGGFLDDAYECFDDARLADTVMTSVAADMESMIPLTARRCALSGWKAGQV
ncbi:MAG TPA: SAM-dependent methyltransferase, partial [Nitrospira sp.]|nr:SAM-dependent methyltransferase [Nitrospira sp.]